MSYKNIIRLMSLIALLCFSACGNSSQKQEDQKFLTLPITKAELHQIISAEIKNVIKAGANADDVVKKKINEGIEASVLKKTGLNSLTGIQKSALRSESARILKEETDAAAKASTSAGEGLDSGK